jgi:hypothetical protein
MNLAEQSISEYGVSLWPIQLGAHTILVQLLDKLLHFFFFFFFVFINVDVILLLPR